jgi:hypothetical protein
LFPTATEILRRSGQESGRLIDPCVFLIRGVFFSPLPQALPNQQVVDYPSFKLVIVGDGGTGEFPRPFSAPSTIF